MYFLIIVSLLLSGCASSPHKEGVSEPVIQQYLDLARDSCRKFSRLNHANFSYNQAVKHIQYSHHNYDYFIIDGRHLHCTDCATCYHTDEGYDLKVFVRKKTGPLLLAFNRIVLRYELLDPEAPNHVCTLKVIVRGNPRTQKDAIYLKFDGKAYQAVARDPDIKHP